VKTSKLMNRDHPAVKTALEKTCPACNATPGNRCLTPRKRPMKRIVHYARCEFQGEL
jgi:hypothetical protein